MRLSWDDTSALLEGDSLRYERIARLAAWVLHALGPTLQPWLEFSVANGYRLARSRKGLSEPRVSKLAKIEDTFRRMPGVRSKDDG